MLSPVGQASHQLHRFARQRLETPVEEGGQPRKDVPVFRRGPEDRTRLQLDLSQDRACHGMAQLSQSRSEPIRKAVLDRQVHA